MHIFIFPYSSISPVVLKVFCAVNAGSDHNLDLNLGISTPSCGDGPKDNERLGHLQFHPYAVQETRRSNVIVDLCFP